ncbi:unnamed protein product [Cylicocyclus nassatus]|uniref:Carboxypeptidase n=1 Tax=Cylicocyclus nassatus TaxID=53992 RepID=A0AA36HCK6_CYLNA|nr:unnamed protein product [Cylicocyclus nassatus]
MCLLFLLLPAIVFNAANGGRSAQARADRVVNLPRVSFQTNFQQFAGYLNSSDGTASYRLHYWYIESQSNPATDALILYISGRQCSSAHAMVMNIGPFRSFGERKPLYENVFSWNKIANLLVIDPPGVGYSSNSKNLLDDKKIATVMTNALTSFLAVYPERANNTIYLVGEGYASVYVTKIARNILQQLELNQAQMNLQGILLGNGLLSEEIEFNTIIPFVYMHAFAGKDQWNDLRSSCCPEQSTMMCNFYNNPNTTCREKARVAVKAWLANQTNQMDVYQDCYHQHRDLWDKKATLLMQSDHASSDPWNGYPCHALDSTRMYLENDTVQNALHANVKFTTCAQFNHNILATDLTNDLLGVLNSDFYTIHNISILFYNGDLAIRRNFLSAQNFVRNLSAIAVYNVTVEGAWWFNYYRGIYDNTYGGLRTLYSKNLAVISIRLYKVMYSFTMFGCALLVRESSETSGTCQNQLYQGTGHAPSTDRPAQTLQMSVNFLRNNHDDYSTPILRGSDLIVSMPGLRWSLPFKQYSGFLRGSNTHMLHYWLVESENDPAKAPLLLWLNGGPGASSLFGLFDNGPFRIGKDGFTITRVGYSYSTDGVLPQYTDEVTAAENYAALIDFFNLYPEYRTRPFYATGESYAGMYIPALSVLLIQGIQNGTLSINYRGMAIGNGLLSKQNVMDFSIHLLYYHGYLTQEIYNILVSLCCGNVTDELNCRLRPRFAYGKLASSNGSDNQCHVFVELVYKFMIGGSTIYNLNQQCYTQKTSNQTAPVGDTWTGNNYDSSDPYMGYYCYKNASLTTYMNLDSVRSALNIPTIAAAWVSNSENIYSTYNRSTTVEPLLTYMINSSYYDTSNFSILLYYGDVDTVCDWMDAEWLTMHYFTDSIGFSLPAREPWFYQSGPLHHPTLAGFARRYSKNIDVLTVKGAGHFVPLDRPMQTLQMIYNWVNGADYSAPCDIIQTTNNMTIDVRHNTKPESNTASTPVVDNTAAINGDSALLM